MLSLYVPPNCAIGHAVRLVLAEKELDVKVQFFDPAAPPEQLRQLGGGAEAVTLVDRDLVLHEPGVVMEYLDERFPHPPLMPTDPVLRATHRQLRQRIGRDLWALLPELTGPNEVAAAGARKGLRDRLAALAPALARGRYAFSADYSLLDCCLAPLLWRLGHYGVRLPEAGRPVLEYGRALFARLAFKASLSEAERRLARA